MAENQAQGQINAPRVTYVLLTAHIVNTVGTSSGESSYLDFSYVSGQGEGITHTYSNGDQEVDLDAITVVGQRMSPKRRLELHPDVPLDVPLYVDNFEGFWGKVDHFWLLQIT